MNHSTVVTLTAVALAAWPMLAFGADKAPDLKGKWTGKTYSIVAGSGGFSASAPVGSLPSAPITVGEYTLELDPIVAFGYLLLTVDMSTKKPKLTISFRSNAQGVTHDSIALKLT